MIANKVRMSRGNKQTFSFAIRGSHPIGFVVLGLLQVLQAMASEVKAEPGSGDIIVGHLELGVAEEVKVEVDQPDDENIDELPTKCRSCMATLVDDCVAATEVPSPPARCRSDEDVGECQTCAALPMNELVIMDGSLASVPLPEVGTVM